MNTTVSTPRRWRTILLDGLGFIGAVWSIPLAILLVGTPIVLAVALVMMAVQWIFR